MNNTVKIEKLQNAIEAIRALGEGYDGYAYVVEKLQDEITVLQHAEKAEKVAQEKAEHDAWVAAYWERYEKEQSLKQELKAKIPQLRAAVQDASERLQACHDAREWPELDYKRRMAMSELEDAEKRLRWL